MKHKHFDMIIAKAENMHLYALIKHNNEPEWKCMSRAGSQFPDFGGTHDYFLCLPKHKESCLHWLNGGDVLIRDFKDDSSERILKAIAQPCWHGATVFTSNEASIRVKPKKEKRWIIVDQKTDYTFNFLFMSKFEADKENGGEHQVVEIEVEVNG